MDETVNRARTRRVLLEAMLAALALAGAGGLQAQALPDPTRPPALLLLRVAGGDAQPAVPGSAAPQLQSVLIARQAGGRQVAVIDGVTLRLGEIYNGARLVRMSETEVELVRGRERQVLKLFAGAIPKAVPAVQR